MPVNVIAGCRASGSTWCAPGRLEDADARAGRWCARRSGRPARRRSPTARRRGRRGRRRARRAARARRRRRPSGDVERPGTPGSRSAARARLASRHGRDAGDAGDRPAPAPRRAPRRPGRHRRPDGEAGGVLDAQGRTTQHAYGVAADTRAPGVDGPLARGLARRPLRPARLLPARRAVPAGHFTTAPTGRSGALLAEALGRLADREGATHVVDVGLRAGRAARPPPRRPARTCGSPGSTSSTGRRPCRMPSAWIALPRRWRPARRARPTSTDVLVVAHEWLDVVPCTVAEVVAAGPPRGRPRRPGDRCGVARRPAVAGRARLVLAGTGPSTGLPVGPGSRSGLTRDVAWADLVARVRSGIAPRRRLRPHPAVTGRRTARSRHTATGRSSPRCPTGRATSPRTSPSTPSTTTRS